MRRIGLRITGLADAAREKGPFPLFDRSRYLACGYASRLPPDLRDAIAAEGIRNSHLLAIAPTGSISLLAGNVSSGIEPAYAADCLRCMCCEDGVREVEATDYACALYRRGRAETIPPAFVRAHEVAPETQLAMQAELQQYVDNAISNTLNVPRDLPYERFAPLFERAYRLGLKGCTAYRPHARAGAVLEITERTACCDSQRGAPEYPSTTDIAAVTRTSFRTIWPRCGARYLASPAGVDVAALSSRTRMPSRTRSAGYTMTRSPGRRPFSTAACMLFRRGASISCLRARPSRTTNTAQRASSRNSAPTGTNIASSRACTTMRASTR